MSPGAERVRGPGARTRWRRALDRSFHCVCIAAAFSAILVLCVLLYSIFSQGSHYLTPGFLSRYPSRHPAESGFRAALWGSVWLCVVCALVAMPLGVGTAILLEEYRPRSRFFSRLHAVVQVNISNLAGVPSIVYGVIGLTVFVRMFGLLGNPHQYDLMLLVTLDSGRVVVGEVVQDEPSVVVMDVAEVAGATLTDPGAPPRGVEISRAIVLDDPSLIDDAAPGQTITVRVARDFNLPFDLAFALEYEEPADPPAVISVTGTLSEVRAGTLVLDHPTHGRVEVAASEIASRRPFSIRAHQITLTDGRAVRCDAIDYEEDRLILVTRGGGAVAIERDRVAGYRQIRPLEIGRPGSPFYLRLPLGSSILAGALTLMLVVLPVVIISSQEALRAVPDSLREGALAAGATRWQMVSRMVLPAAMPGIMTGAILAMSRAIGEAAPLLVVGGILYITFTPVNLMSDFAAMPLQIYQWASRPQEEFYRVAASGIIVLLAVLLIFNASAILIRQKFQKPLQ